MGLPRRTSSLGGKVCCALVCLAGFATWGQIQSQLVFCAKCSNPYSSVQGLNRLGSSTLLWAARKR